MSGVPEASAFVDALTPALRQAAAVARKLEGRVQNEPKSGETTPAKQALTAADIATQEALLGPLLQHFPDVSLEAEEDTPSAERFPEGRDALVVIDPIDGTLHSYLGGEGPYAIMVGLAVARRYQAALVALPREGLFFSAVRGAGALFSRATGPVRPARITVDGSRVLVSHGMPEAVGERLRAGGLDVLPACGGAVAVAPLLPGVRAGLRFAPASEGVSIRGRIGALIAAEAGAVVRGAGGAFPDDLDTPAPVLAVAHHESDLPILNDALRAAGLDDYILV